MPGVPPDAVTQVKKGLRGLFNRRKSKQQQTDPEPTSTSKDAAAPTSTTTAAAAAPASIPSATQTKTTANSSGPPPPQPASTDPNKAPQLSEPSQSELAKDIDLNPMSDTKTEASSGMPEPSKAMTEPSAATTEPSATMTEPSTGMSATSGPLGDHMAEPYIDDDDVGPKGETLEQGEEKVNPVEQEATKEEVEKA